MGQNSTEVAYGFGQLGSSFIDTTGAHTPPTGKVIIAIQFLEDTTLAVLVADISQHDPTPVAGNTGYFSHTTAVQAVHGSGSDETDSGTTFPKGLTIYGRWTSVELTGASAAGGIICYFGH
tara:strand:- start:831 stop:1193 length:363 start_codon:yes stop_codon:yes gene_type:complete